MIIAHRVSKSSAIKRVVDFSWPIGDDIIYGISLAEINALDNLQREQLLKEISEGIRYFNAEKEQCRRVDFFRKRWLAKNIRELEHLYSTVEKGISKGFYVSRHTGII